ncbi:MAG TPA: TIR domain-containing protein [Thermomicrobiales bacterium]|nr:TIR domain-containing protein [Thermomicrobiales bacterium]
MPEQAGQDATRVFVSYASVDRDRVMPIVRALQDIGVDVWIDQNDIAGGTLYAAEIADGIQGCAALVLMCSVASLASHNVRQELALAWKYRRPYLPLLLEPVTIPRELEYWLEGSQWIELLDQPADVWLPKLRQAIERLELGMSTPGATPQPAVERTTSTLFDVPVPLAPLVGRRETIDAVIRLIDSTRLVTLTGAGGSGKTRLALAAAEAIRDRFAGDIVFVDLAPIRDPELVLPTIATRLGIQTMGDQPILTAMTQALARRELLLILDNLEQVIDAAPQIAGLLAVATKLRVLATSRSPLQLAGEQEYPVVPLSVPDLANESDLEEMARADAVQLFALRAQLIRPEFQVSEDNVAAIAEICVRLDGLPLAIELAASRLRMMSPQALLDRLDRRLPLLAGGRRDLPDRQQTLRSTIDWSHELLQPDEQALLRRLSVFAGGWTLEAADAVAGGAIDVFSGLEALVSQSLVRVNDAADPRYTMLETIREYGLDQLVGAGEAETVHERHATWVLQMVETIAPQTRGPRLVDAMNQLEAEHANILVAIDWFIDRRNATSGWRIAGPLWLFWWMRNHLRVAHQHIQRLLALPREGVPVETLARGLTCAGIVNEWLNLADVAARLQTDALEIWERVPFDFRTDEYWSHACLSNLAMRSGDLERAREQNDRTVEIARERNDEFLLAMASVNPGVHASLAGKFAEAASIYREALTHARRSGDPWAISLILGNLISAVLELDGQADIGADLDELITLNTALGHTYHLILSFGLRGTVALREGRPQDALADIQEARVLARRFGNAYTEAAELNDIGRIYLLLDRVDEARETYRDSLSLGREYSMPATCPAALEGIARILHISGRPASAIRIVAAADAIRATHGPVLAGTDREAIEQLLPALRSALGDSVYAAEWVAGAAMTMDEAIAYALAP